MKKFESCRLSLNACCACCVRPGQKVNRPRSRINFLYKPEARSDLDLRAQLISMGTVATLKGLPATSINGTSARNLKPSVLLEEAANHDKAGYASLKPSGEHRRSAAAADETNNIQVLSVAIP